jgi:uncharacterized damage-inducible protein DinB
MRETERIVALLKAFYEGDCWIGLNFKQAIDGVDVIKASVKRESSSNSIWQLVNHLIYWRKTVIIRLQGVLGNPPMNDFYQPDTYSKKSWEETIKHFGEVNEALIQAIQIFPDEKLNHPSPMKGQTYHDLLIGCMQHDAYHLGQIVMLKKGEK